MGTSGTNRLNQMNKIVSKNEIKELEYVRIINGLNKFQHRCDSIPCIFHSIFFFKPFVGNPLSYKTGKIPLKRDLFHFFNFLSKNFLLTFKNLLIQLFYFKSVNFFSSEYVLSTFLT